MSNPLRVGIALGTGLHHTRHSQKLDGRPNVSLQFPARFLHKHVRHVRLRVPPLKFKVLAIVMLSFLECLMME